MSKLVNALVAAERTSATRSMAVGLPTGVLKNDVESAAKAVLAHIEHLREQRLAFLVREEVQRRQVRNQKLGWLRFLAKSTEPAVVERELRTGPVANALCAQVQGLRLMSANLEARCLHLLQMAAQSPCEQLEVDAHTWEQVLRAQMAAAGS